MTLNDNMQLDHVIVEEGTDVPGTMYIVTEVFTNMDTGDTEVGLIRVNGEDMVDFMKGYGDDTHIVDRT